MSLTTNIVVIDIVLVLIMIWGGYKGFRRGCLLELISTFIFLAGLVLIFWGVANLSYYFNPNASSTRTSTFVTLVIVFIVGGIALNALGKAIQKRIDYSVFDDFDNFIGLALGLMKYAIYLSICLTVFDRVGWSSDELMQQSQVYQFLLDFYDWWIAAAGEAIPIIRETDEKLKTILLEKAAGSDA